jgi:glucosamine--fructose-6-phosphate aminotransferase (isomerizing)
MNGDYITFADARSTQAARLGEAVETISAQLDDRAAQGQLEGSGPIFVGIGASLAAACAPVWALRSRGIHSWRLGAGDHPLPFPASDHPIFGISQSGRSAETLAVLESVDESLRYAVVNRAPSPISEVVEKTIVLGSIPDSYASTIGYTATVVALGMIADAWNGGGLDAGWQSLSGTFSEFEQRLAPQVPTIARVFAEADSADFVGAGPAVGSAEAGALLFREVARVHSTGMSTRQYLHGSMESASDGVHVVLGDKRELRLAATLSDSGHNVILITGEDVAEGPNLHVIKVPKLAAAQRAVLEALVMQALVSEVADLKGIDVEEFVFTNSDTKVPVASQSAPQGVSQ